MKKYLIAALALVTLSGCAESPAFRHATYVGRPYRYDENNLPILQARDDAPGATFINPWRGRNWR
jgi:hypothetical protein